MAITITSREFNQYPSRVLKMAEREPVFITKWGKIVNVVSNYIDYQQPEKPKSVFDVFSAPHPVDTLDIDDFEQILSDVRQNTTFRIAEFE